MESLFREFLPSSLDGLAPLLANAVMAAIFLVVGFWFAGVAATFIRKRATSSERIDDTLGSFFASIARYAILTVVIIAVLQRFGFEATSLVAVLGAATLAVGFALQGVLGNVAAGVMIVFFRPYKLGDFVDIGDNSGTVKDINLVSTELNTPQNIKIIVPNGEAWGSAITNYSAHDRRRMDITVGISYDDDIETAIDTVLKVARDNALIINEPAEPWVRVVELADSSVNLQLRAWAMQPDFWEAKFGLTRAIKEALDAAGVEIPYPHQTIVRKDAAADDA